MTVRWVENARGGGTPQDHVRPAPDAPARSDGRPAGTGRRATDERDRR